MNIKHVESKFAEMGGRLKLRETLVSPFRFRSRNEPDYAMDIQQDDRGKFFELRIPETLRGRLELTVMQAEPQRQHLLLLIRKQAEQRQLDRFLCGHDERDWFVAAVPGGASSIRQAMDALQPADVRDSLARHGVSYRKRYERKNRAFRRQGEWFFVPAPEVTVHREYILWNEPLRRGAGKPHLLEQVSRIGGEAVYVCRAYPNGISIDGYRSLIRKTPGAAGWGWHMMQRNPGLFARGTVRHADHETIVLPFWHRVVMNTETQSRTMANVAFLD